MQLMFKTLTSQKLKEGDYLEFGVWQGNSMVNAYKCAVECGLHDMKFYAFDSFEGLPDFSGRDAEYNRFTKGQYCCSEDKFRENLVNAGVDMSKVVIVPGFYNETLGDELKQSLDINRAAVIWVDCDLYESTVPVLNFIKDYINSGTVIAFDDWFTFNADPHAGEYRAVREWLELNKNITLEYYKDFGRSGRIFFVQKW